jgi:hypothetical protein
VFGDSLSDNGNSLFLLKAPQLPFYKGRSSNGPNWVDHFPLVAHHFPTVAAYFPDPDNDNGTNFAVHGSVSANFLQPKPTDLPAQIPTWRRGQPPLELGYALTVSDKDIQIVS